MGTVDTFLNTACTIDSLATSCNNVIYAPTPASISSAAGGRGQLIAKNTLTEGLAEANGPFIVSSFNNGLPLAGTEIAAKSTMLAKGKSTMNMTVGLNGSNAFNYSDKLSSDNVRTLAIVVLKTASVIAKPQVYIYTSVPNITYILMFIKSTDQITELESSAQGVVYTGSINVQDSSTAVIEAGYGGTCGAP